MSSGNNTSTGLFMGTDPVLGRVGLLCSTPCLAVYMYSKDGQKLARTPWNAINRLEVAQDQLEVTFKKIPGNIWLNGASKITFRGAHVNPLVQEMISKKLIKKCDRGVQLFTGRVFYKPTSSSPSPMQVDYLATEALFKAVDPEQIPLIEL